MKLLLLLAVILLAVWLWRSGRGEAAAPKPRAKRKAEDRAAPAAPQEMVRCARCGLHLPLTEAVASRQAHYCSSEHRRQTEPGEY